MKYTIEFEKHELLALHKALNYIKFYSQEYETTEFALSPIILELIIKVQGDLGKDDKRYLDKNFIEEPNQQQVLNVIKKHLLNITDSDWKAFSFEVKSTILKTLIQPYKYKNETIDQLVYEEDIRRSSN